MENKLLLRYFLSSLCGAWMVAISLRFIIDSYLNKQLYQVNQLDVWFDWGILLALGIFVFVIIFFDIIGRWKKMEKNTKMIIIKTDDLKPDEFVKLLDVLRVNRE